MKSERNEALNSAEATASRLKDAETAASRAKALRRDELKKEKKERSALVQRCEVGSDITGAWYIIGDMVSNVSAKVQEYSAHFPSCGLG